MKFLGSFLTITLFSIMSYAQLVLNPAPSSGEIALTKSSTYIYITNQSATIQTLSLSLSGSSGIGISMNRCSSVKANSSCYIVVSVPTYATNSSALSAVLSNGASQLATLTVAPIVAPTSSVFSVSSLAMDGFSNFSFTIQNKTSTAKTYAPVIGGVDSSKYSIALNRCSTSVAPNGTCLVYVKLAPQEAGSFSASITEPQVTGSISLSSTITGATVGVIQPPNPSITSSASSLAFGTISNLGKTSSKTFTITNNGNIAVSPIVAVSGAGLEISLNRCLSLLSPNQSCSVSVLFNAVSSMTNGVQSGLSFSAQATLSTTPIVSNMSATLAINPVLLSSSGGSVGTPLATPLLINSAGGNMFHYSTVNNKLYSWGANSYYVLVGDGTAIDRGDAYSLMDNAPLIGKSLKDFGFFDDHSCLLTTDNNIYCWGYNYAGQSNPLLDGSISVPTLMPKGDMGSKTIKKLAIGSYFSVALSDDGHVYFWGANGAGQSGSIIGSAPTPSDLAYCGSPYGGPVDCQTIVIPKEIDMSGALAGKSFTDITATYSNVCGITTSNQVFCWGQNYSGAVGDGTNTDAFTPKEIDMTGALAGKTIKKLYMAYGPSCVMTTEDLLYCWGDNYFGQLGIGSINPSENSPQPVDMTAPALVGKTVKSYYPGYATSCMIASDDQAYCWGWNSVGQLGTGSLNYTESSPQPVDMSGALSGKTIKKFSIPIFSGNTICAIASDDKPYCWGSNQAGQLGDGTTNDSWIPLATDPSGILSGKTISDISSHGGSACVLANDSNVYCIGANYNGQLGNGNANIGNSSSVFVLAPTIP
jgi:alpha-tubulin suppressor-like RCC1 family protein